LRDGIESGEVQRAVLDFLAAHEPDLLAAAEALDLAPGVLIGAGDRLGA
jgi:hypothetical protein